MKVPGQTNDNRTNDFEAVISGVGLLTCLGDNVHAVWESLLQNKSGITSIQNFDTEDSRSDQGGEIKALYPYDGKSRMAAFLKKCLWNAVQDSGLTLSQMNDSNGLVIIGTSLGHMFHNEEGPVVLDDYVQVAFTQLGLTLPFLILSSACSSGSDAIGTGADMIEFGACDFVICGGVDILDLYKQKGHSSLRTLSDDVCRPFSDVNYGTSLGEGAAFIVLEAREYYSSREHGMEYGTLIGRSSSTDNASVTNPDETGEGAMRTIETALSRTKYGIEDIVYINAHGSGTEINDRMERIVYEQLFSNTRPFLSSVKGAFGHLLGAAGAAEGIVALMAIYYRQIPPTAGCEVPSKEWEDTGLVLNQPAYIENSEPLISISVTYGFGGANSCLVFFVDRSNAKD